MPVQVALKFSVSVEESVVRRTGIFGRDEIAAQTTDLGDEDSRIIVLLDEQCQGTPDGDTRFRRLDVSACLSTFELHDHWKYNNFLFCQVVC